MLKRTITGAFITAAVYLVLAFSYIPWVLPAAITVLSVFSVYEIYHAANLPDEELPLILSILAAMGLAVWKIPYDEMVLTAVFFAAAITFGVLMVYQKRFKRVSPLLAGWIVFLVVMLFKAFTPLRRMEHGVLYLTMAVTMCFVTDVAAYLIGSKWGKHKLAPKISPNKTVEGALAGVIFTEVFALGVGAVLSGTGAAQIQFGWLGLYAVLASVAGQFGDLSMSAVKRICGVKDFGNLFPGHGGVLDRFDSHIFAVAFTFLFYAVTGGYII